VTKEPIGNVPQKDMSTDAISSKNKRKMPYMSQVSKDNQFPEMREGVVHKQEGLKSSGQMFLRSMNSAICFDSRTNNLKLFPE